MSSLSSFIQLTMMLILLFWLICCGIIECWTFPSNTKLRNEEESNQPINRIFALSPDLNQISTIKKDEDTDESRVLQPIMSICTQSDLSSIDIHKEITGPIYQDGLNTPTKRVYYDVVFPPQCIIDWKSQGFNIPTSFINKSGLDHLGIWDWERVHSEIMWHWKHTLPPEIKPFYPESDPQIFFHGRNTDPYVDLERDGYLHDEDPFKSLWTVAITEYSSDISVTVANMRHPTRNVFLVVFQLMESDVNNLNVDKSVSYYSTDPMPTNLESEPGIILQFNIGEYEHPSAWIFTKEAQKVGNSPLKIVRVYQMHFPLDRK